MDISTVTCNYDDMTDKYYSYFAFNNGNLHSKSSRHNLNIISKEKLHFRIHQLVTGLLEWCLIKLTCLMWNMKKCEMKGQGEVKSLASCVTLLYQSLSAVRVDI